MACCQIRHVVPRHAAGRFFRLAAGLFVLWVVPAGAGDCGVPGGERGQAEESLAHEALRPGIAAAAEPEDAYARRVNAALRAGRDVWGEELIGRGGASYEALQDLLHPLFYSTGQNNKTLGVHNLLFGRDGGRPPYVIPLADGSRIAANIYNSPRYIEFFVGPGGGERFGSALDRLAGPRLDQGYYPVLQLEYRDACGTRYTSESFAAPLEGTEPFLAFVKFTFQRGDSAATSARLVVRFGQPARDECRSSGAPRWENGAAIHEIDLPDAGPRSIYLIWSPEGKLPAGAVVGAAQHEEAKSACRTFWDRRLGQGARFEVPEAIVMNAQRNLLIQNLIMRWRYSLGSVVYHNEFYQPESSDTVSTLGLFGFLDAYRDGLEDLAGMTKGQGQYVNWERGEKLSHAAHYYWLTRDAELIRRLLPRHVSYCDAYRQQLETDPHGLLHKERYSGDIADAVYATFHQAVAWRGLRDMAEVWKELGEERLWARYRPLADRFRDSLLQAVVRCAKDLPDGSLFVPARLFDHEAPYTRVTETRLGSYWNLCMPYAFSSGLWDPRGREMDRIVDYMHGHGSILAGLLRFNYYPTAIGAHRPDGLPGYSTTGLDNVYLPSYLRLLADRDEADRLLVSFYAKLAHGQTRNTFVSGEGETVGPVPGERFRSCYGTPNSANNTAFLLPLRLLLVRESFDQDTGVPRGLYLAHATPRAWLADGRTIRVEQAPTCFGPLSYTIDSRLRENKVSVRVRVPSRNQARPLHLRLRVPGQRAIAAVQVNGRPHAAFDPKAELIDLSDRAGDVAVDVAYR